MTSAAVDMTPKIFYLDLEVSHVPKDEGEPERCITELCVIDPDRDPIKGVFEAYVKPPCQLVAKKEEHDFSHGHVEPPKRAFGDVWTGLKKFVNDGMNNNPRRVFFIAHNAYDHDWLHLKAECTRIGEVIPRHWGPFCSLRLSNTIHVPCDHSLEALVEHYSVTPLEAHKAYNDTVMLKGVFEKMIGSAPMKEVANAMADPHPIINVARVVRLHSSKPSVTQIADRVNKTAVLVFFDFETTGLFKYGQPDPRVVELAGYIPMTNSSFGTYVNPGCPIPPESTKIHGIKDKDVKESPGFKQAWTDFEGWIEKETSHVDKKVVVLAGHNIIGYDIKVYRAEAKRLDMKTKWWKCVDTYPLARSLFAGTEMPNHKLQDIREMMGIAADQAHRAVGDVRVNWKVFQEWVKGLGERELNIAYQGDKPHSDVCQLIKSSGAFKPTDYFEGKKIVAAVVNNNDDSDDDDQPIVKRRRLVKDGESSSSDIRHYFVPKDEKVKEGQRVTVAYDDSDED